MLKESDVLLCTVKKIERTTVFVTLQDGSEGSIVMSEIAAGRIRNIRDYVTPNRKIVCKVLRIIRGHPQLSLRRVTTKERSEVLDAIKKERTFTSMLKTLSLDPNPIIEKIKESQEISDFMEDAREDPKLIEKYLPKPKSLELSKILEEKKDKEKIVSAIVTIKSESPTGLEDIKSILDLKDCKISYLGSSRFSIFTKGKDFKEANAALSTILEQIKDRAKKKEAHLDIKEKK